MQYVFTKVLLVQPNIVVCVYFRQAIIVTGIGCFIIQKGSTEMYRGAKVAAKMLPKVKVELIVSKIPVETIVSVAKQVLYTGKYGDGKIFVYDVENVFKIRTGESGYDALQDKPLEE